MTATKCTKSVLHLQKCFFANLNPAFLTFPLPLQSSNFKFPSNLGEITPATQAKSLNLLHCATGSPSSKYEHWHCCVTFEILGFVWEKNYCFCNLRKWTDFNNKKNSSPYIKCVLQLSCVVHGPINGRFMGCTVNGFLSLYKVYTNPYNSNVTQQCRCSYFELGLPVIMLYSPPNFQVYITPSYMTQALLGAPECIEFGPLP